MQERSSLLVCVAKSPTAMFACFVLLFRVVKVAEQVNEHGQQPRLMSCNGCHYKTQQMNREASYELIQELNTDLIRVVVHV